MNSQRFVGVLTTAHGANVRFFVWAWHSVKPNGFQAPSQSLELNGEPLLRKHIVLCLPNYGKSSRPVHFADLGNNTCRIQHHNTKADYAAFGFDALRHIGFCLEAPDTGGADDGFIGHWMEELFCN